MKIVATIGSKIRSYPMVFGMLIGLVLILGVIVIVDWFPRVSEAWDRHNRLVQSTWFTAGFFGVWVNYYWHWWRRGFFWTSICILFLVHTLGVLYYATQIHPLILRDWIVLLTVESFVLGFFMESSIRRFGHPSRHPHPDRPSGIQGGS
jgi:hypothetical protein